MGKLDYKIYIKKQLVIYLFAGVIHLSGKGAQITTRSEKYVTKPA
jgi:hypothetical protein